MPVINASVFARGASESLTSGWAPAGATAQTMRRDLVYGSTGALSSGTLYVRAIQAPAGTAFTNASFISQTAETGGSHCWACILDATMTVRGVSADNPGGTFLSGAGAVITFALTSGGTYTAPYDGLYWVGICAVFSGTAPTLAGASTGVGVAAVAPSFWGNSTGGLSTPPALTTVMAACNGSGAYNLYAWTS